MKNMVEALQSEALDPYFSISTERGRRQPGMAFITDMVRSLQLMFRRPPRQQYAALCYRWAPKSNRVEILLLTSRDTGRWIIRKG